MRFRLADSNGNPVASPRLVESSFAALQIHPTTGRLLVDAGATGAGSSTPAAPSLANAALVQWLSGDLDLTTTAQGLNIAFDDIAGTVIVRKLTVCADVGNLADVLLGPVDSFTGDGGTPRRLIPGQEYVIECHAGTKFLLSSWMAKIESGTGLLSCFSAQ